MQFIYYKNKVMRLVRGKLPRSIFVWFVVLLSSVFASMLLISMWYYHIFTIYNSRQPTGEMSEYKQSVDIDGLEEIVTKYRL